jgi:hypothetical protein
MNIFKIMNLAAWALSAFFAALILIDFIKVEYSRVKNGGGNNE